jgi:CheY-like chemotaxis protein
MRNHRKADKTLGLLLVDDEPELLALLLTSLSSFQGIRVEAATSGPHALNLLQEFKPLLVVTDLLMPDMDGWSLVASMRLQPELNDIRVVAMTASPNPLAIERATDLGVVRVIPKPFDMHEFMTIVSAELSRAAQLSQGPIS